jgi:hypothetical protein
MIDPQFLLNKFRYHPPVNREQQIKYETMRERALYFAEFINENVPDGHEKSEAIDRLREALMWANAGIACGEAPNPVAWSSPTYMGGPVSDEAPSSVGQITSFGVTTQFPDTPEHPVADGTGTIWTLPNGLVPAKPSDETPGSVGQITSFGVTTQFPDASEHPSFPEPFRGGKHS